jgi:NADPH2:quinone reductase
LDLKAWGASEVIELASLSQSVGDQIMEITQRQGVNGVVDCVGGPVVGELIRSLSFGGQFIIYFGFNPKSFELHNFDILMKGSGIQS